MKTTLAKHYLEEALELLDQSMFKIEHCFEQISHTQLWQPPAPELNSIGNLALHICGNLRQWAIVSTTGQKDLRDRDAEFDPNCEHLEKEVLLSLLRETINDAKTALAENGSTETQLLAEHQIQGFNVTLLAAVTHTTAHFVGHTHQIIFITRSFLGESYSFQWSEDSGRDRVPI